MTSKVSLAYEQREAFAIFYSSALKHLYKNTRIYKAKVKLFRVDVELPLKLLAVETLTRLFGVSYMRNIPVSFEFFTFSDGGNSGGTEFSFTKKPSIDFMINLNKELKMLYKQDIKLFCLTLADVYSHELMHCIQCIQQYKSVGTNLEALKESPFKNKEHLLEKDFRYLNNQDYCEDIDYFSTYSELVCYAKDTARQLLTYYNSDLKLILNKLATSKDLSSLSEVSSCFSFYYNCFYNNTLPEYRNLWQRFLKYLYYNLHESFSV